MSFALNQGPSFNVTRPGSSYPKLNGFYQRFMLTQDDPRFTPGKKELHLPQETMKGTTKLKRSNRKVGEKVRCRDSVPTGNPEPIYGGFANIKNKASTKIVKAKRKKRKKKSK